MVDTAEQIDPAWVVGKIRVGVTAGASAPEVLVQLYRSIEGMRREKRANSVRCGRAHYFSIANWIGQASDSRNLSQPNA